MKCNERGLTCEYLDGPETPASSVQLERLARLSQDPNALSELLATLPYFDALELFEMFRKMPRDATASSSSAVTPESSASSSKSSPPCTPLPAEPPSPVQYNLVGSLLPPASNPMEQELMVRHPIAYPVLMPIAVSVLPLETLLAPRKAEILGERLLLSATPSERIDTSMASSDNGTFDGWCNNLSHLSQLHIEHLHQVDIALWTELPIPNDVAIRVIALYLNNDYPVLPLFNADLFLQDLSQNRPYFCSRLLVSALLGWACVSQSHQMTDSKLKLLCSKPTRPYTPKQHPGARFSFLMLRLSGADWATMSLPLCQAYPHYSFYA